MRILISDQNFGDGAELERRLAAEAGVEPEVAAPDPLVPDGEIRAAGVEPLSFDELLMRADVLSVHVPLTEETRGLVGRTQLAMLPEGAIVVNTARGGLVDEYALAEALGSGRLRGAALDVLVTEPPPAD